MAETIPQSKVLAEADPNSLSYLFSLDPELITKDQRGQIVAAMREQRVKWEASEKAQGTRTRSAVKAEAKTSVAKESAEDLGL